MRSDSHCLDAAVCSKVRSAAKSDTGRAADRCEAKSDPADREPCAEFPSKLARQRVIPRQVSSPYLESTRGAAPAPGCGMAFARSAFVYAAAALVELGSAGADSAGSLPAHTCVSRVQVAT